MTNNKIYEIAHGRYTLLRTFIVGTRGSELALKQTNMVIELLKEAGVKNEFAIKTIATKGDQNLSVALHQVGGTGIFSDELQEALRKKTIDFAVHSLKDLPLIMDEAFMLASFPKREDHRDAFISRDGKTLKDLPEGAVVGTSSARRAAFIHAYYPHLKTEPIRGPVDKRLEQLREGKYDGIILAVAGLKRLDLEHVITEYLPEDKLTPAAGQAALAIECRSDDHEVIEVVRKINDAQTEKSILTERHFVYLLDEEDKTPIGAYAKVEGDRITLYGSVSSLDGKTLIKVKSEGTDPKEVAQQAYEKAVQKGAKEIVERAKQELGKA